jgi:hypothetical protein
MYEKRLRDNQHHGIFATRPIEAGTVLFTHDDWVEDEARGWDTLDIEEVAALPEPQRQRYLRYAYDISFGQMIGTFDWERAQHISNFMNHSCEPNMIYGTDDDIIAVQDIEAGEELTIDYANFIVNVDQDFSCGCGAPRCRHNIRRDDWMALVPTHGLHFPRFMHDAVRQRLGVR